MAIDAWRMILLWEKLPADVKAKALEIAKQVPRSYGYENWTAKIEELEALFPEGWSDT